MIKNIKKFLLALVFAGSLSTISLADYTPKTGTGLAVLNNGPTLIAPVLGTPASGVATNLTGTASALSIGGNAATATTASALTTARAIGGVNFDGSADITPTQIQPAAENSDTTNFPLFANAASGTAQQPKYNSSFGYNASTNALTATTFIGALTGNASTVTNGIYTTDTGTVTNTMLAGSITNAKLSSSAVTVNGTSISLGASGTVTAAAGTLTGTTLNSTVTASSLVSTGTLTGGATGTGFTIALGSSTVTGTVATANGGLGANESAATGVVQMSSGTTTVSTALSSGTTATTQAASDNSTKVATTAYATTAVKYPISMNITTDAGGL